MGTKDRFQPGETEAEATAEQNQLNLERKAEDEAEATKQNQLNLEQEQLNAQRKAPSSGVAPPNVVQGNLAREELQGPRVGTDADGRAQVIPPPDPNEPMVPMVFPRAVNLQHNGIMYRFEKGLNQVRQSLTDHWWLKDNQVVKFKE